MPTTTLFGKRQILQKHTCANSISEQFLFMLCFYFLMTFSASKQTLNSFSVTAGMNT